MQNFRKIGLLQENLAEQTKIYSSLCHLLQSENDYLIQSDVNNINKSAVLKDGLLRAAETKEEERLSLCSDLATDMRLRSETPKLLEIATKLPEPYRSKLIQHKSSLENLFAEIKRLNHENEILAEAALSTIGGTIDRIKDALAPKQTYQAGGKKKDTNQTKHLVHREA